MKKRFVWKKISTGEKATCYYCPKKTNFALAERRDGSEVWCCSECALRIGKIKRLKKLLKKYPLHNTTSKEKEISKPIPLIKKIDNAIPGGVM